MWIYQRLLFWAVVIATVLITRLLIAYDVPRFKVLLFAVIGLYLATGLMYPLNMLPESIYHRVNPPAPLACGFFSECMMWGNCDKRCTWVDWPD
jgi:4-hydroxybenzoate polyprenyltransferase